MSTLWGAPLFVNQNRLSNGRELLHFGQAGSADSVQCLMGSVYGSHTQAALALWISVGGQQGSETPAQRRPCFT